jgi:hypothetical protein
LLLLLKFLWKGVDRLFSALDMCPPTLDLLFHGMVAVPHPPARALGVVVAEKSRTASVS